MCRLCGSHEIELAHTVGRIYDIKRGKTLYVHPLSVIPLCRRDHTRFDSHSLNLWGYLTEDERNWAVRRCGEAQAKRKIMGRGFFDA